MRGEPNKTLVLISYNPVNGFESGWHGSGKLFVCASDNGAGACIGDGADNKQRAGSVMHKISGSFHFGSVPVENVKQFIVYAGLSAFEGAIYMAQSLKKSAPGVPITIIACSCYWDRKVKLLRDTDIGIEKCECGGESTLGRLAKQAITS